MVENPAAVVSAIVQEGAVGDGGVAGFDAKSASSGGRTGLVAGEAGILDVDESPRFHHQGSSARTEIRTVDDVGLELAAEDVEGNRAFGTYAAPSRIAIGFVARDEGVLDLAGAEAQGDAAAHHDLSGEDEERDGEQGEDVDARDHALKHDQLGDAGIAGRGQRGDAEGEGDGNAGDDADRERSEEEGEAHRMSFPHVPRNGSGPAALVDILSILVSNDEIVDVNPFNLVITFSVIFCSKVLSCCSIVFIVCSKVLIF